MAAGLKVFMELLRPQTRAGVNVENVAAFVLLQRRCYVSENIVCGSVSAAAGQELYLLER